MNSATVSSGRLSAIFGGLPRAFWALLAGMFVTRAGSFVLPLLFVYLSEVRKLPLETAGAITSLYGFGSLLGNLIGGVTADRFGRRWTMLCALVLGAGCLLVMGMVETTWQLGVATFATALTSEAFRPASQALVSDVVPEERRLQAFNLLYWAINLGFAVASIVGGYMAERNFQVLFVADAATTLVLATIIWRLVPESRPAPVTGAPRVSLLTPFVDPVFAPFLFLTFVLAMLFFQHLSALPNAMARQGFSTTSYGVVIAANGVLIVLLQPFAARWARRFTSAGALGLASVLAGLGFGLNAFAHSVPAYAAFVGVWTVGEILMAPVNSTLVATLAPRHARGRYQGAYTLAWSVAMMSAPLFASALIPRLGNDTVWMICLALGLGCAAAYATWGARALPKVAPTE